MRNMAQLDSWKDWLEAVKLYDRKCKDFTNVIDECVEQSSWQQHTVQMNRQTQLQEQMLEAFRHVYDHRASEEDKKARNAFLQEISVDYVAQKNNLNPRRVPGTCQWLLQDGRFLVWRDAAAASMLLITAGPGCGKSVLSRALIDECHVTNLLMTSTTCYFFFKDGLSGQQTGTDMLKAILHQLFSQNPNPNLIKFALERYGRHGSKLLGMFDELWCILIETARHEEAGETVCVVDALDECEMEARERLLETFSQHFSTTRGTKPENGRLKFLVTSRPYNDVVLGFQPLEGCATFVHFHGNKKTDIISKEINLVIDDRLEAVTPGMKTQDRASIASLLKSAECPKS